MHATSRTGEGRKTAANHIKRLKSEISLKSRKR